MVVLDIYNNALFSFLLLFCSLIVSALAQPDSYSFSLELIHRDSQNSPLFNNSEVPLHRLINNLKRSSNRVKRFSQTFIGTNITAQSVISSNDGDYLMRISIGTPPREFFVIADTGSDLTWIQCHPCKSCFKQISPLFDPRASSTYRNINCGSTECSSSAENTFCESDSELCNYSCTFGDGSLTMGVLASETVSLSSNTGQLVSIRNTTIGCGTYNQGNFDGSDGLVGLGRGPKSLISRINPLINGKFSYCLVPRDSNHSSKIRFGDNNMVSGPGTVTTTSLVPGTGQSFYYLNLEAITVEGRRRIGFGEFFNPVLMNGNIIIDSGTTLTYLPSFVYQSLESEVRMAINLEPIDKHNELGLRLCYDDAGNDFNPPIITMHFLNGDVRLNSSHTFIRMYDGHTYVNCFAFDVTPDISVYGNVQQTNFLIGYDLASRTLSFKPMDCTQY